MAEVFDSKLLKEAFKEARNIYSKKGFQKRVGYGNRPAIVNVDLANAWTRPGHTFSCDDMDEVVSKVRNLLNVAREKNVPIFFATTGYNPNGYLDLGTFGAKMPIEELKLDDKLIEIDSRLNPQPNEMVFVKKTASCFNGTPLQYWLTSNRIDTVIVTGATASACVRHTCMDSTEFGFRTIVPEGTVTDRIPGAVEWNLFDIDAKFGDVESLKNVINYLQSIENVSPNSVNTTN